MAVLGFGGNDALHSTEVTGFCPRIKIVDDGFAVHCDVKDAKPFVIILRTASIPVPGLSEIEFDTVLAIRHGKIVPKPVATETEELEEFVALSASDVIADMTL